MKNLCAAAMEALERIIVNIRNQLSCARLPGGASAALDFVNSSVNKIKLRPFTRDNILYYYIPIQGLASYTTLSISVMNPQLMLRLFPRRDITNILVLGAGGGAGLWLWGRPHMAAATPARRFSWSFLGGTLWSLGSILLWAILRGSVGRRPLAGTALGILSGVTLTHAAIDYFHYVEVMLCGDVHLPKEIYEPNSDDEKYDIDI